jgi:outer membrane immunogenic protein
MRFWTNTAVVALLTAAAVTPALADETPAATLVPGPQLTQVPPPPPMMAPPVSWGGLYVGVNVGDAWASPKTKSPLTDTGAALPGYIPSVVTDINSQSGVNPSLNNVSGGGQIGYNFQFNNIVVGAEGEFDGWDLHRTAITGAPFTGFPVPATGGIQPTYTNSISSSWWASVRGKVGRTPAPSLLLYATGGVAFSDFKYKPSLYGRHLPRDLQWG